MRLASLLAATTLCVGTVCAQESAQAILERAIAAHGGKEILSRARAEKIRIVGTLHVGQTAMEFVNHQTVQLPGQYRSVVTLQQGVRNYQVIHTLNGQSATSSIDGKAQQVNGPQLAQLRQTLRLEQAMRLVPLLTTPGFTLQALPVTRYNDRVLVGVEVSGQGQLPLKLWFDQPTGLLVKTEQTLDGPQGKAVQQVALYGEYRVLGGRRRPTRVIVTRDGHKMMEASIVEAQAFDRIDASEFHPPTTP